MSKFLVDNFKNNMEDGMKSELLLAIETYILRILVNRA